MSSPRTGAPARAGYTLVEVLVVIGIIAVLIAILLPVVNSVRRAANSTACLATLHQWGAAYQMYLSEHGGRSFPFDHAPVSSRTNPPLWWEHLEPYHPEVRSTLLCPDATDPANVQPTDAFQAWGPMYLWPEPGRTRTSYVGSYGVNWWLYQPIRGPADHRTIRLPSSRSTRIPVVFDSAYFNVGPHHTDPSDFDPQGPLHLGMGWMRQVVLYRHGKGINVAFADGHADHVEVPELWRLQWSQDFVPRIVTPPQ